MRVIAVSHAYPRRNKGSHGIFVHRLHRELVALGVDLEVVQRGDWSPPWPFFHALPVWNEARVAERDFLSDVEGVKVHHPRTFWPRPSRFFHLDPWERAAASITNYCRNHPGLGNADVVLGHFMVPDGYHAVLLGKALNIPVVVMAWGDDVHAWPAQRADWRRRLEFVLENADKLVACSARLADDGNTWLKQPRNDWEVVYGGVDLDDFSPKVPMSPEAREAIWRRVVGTSLGGERVVLTLAQATAAKGYCELLDAWAQITHLTNGWHLVMGGATGELDTACEIDIRRLDSNAHWIGLVQPNEVPEFLRASDAFVLPSHNEGLSLSVLEALATGLPTIATDVGGHHEVISNSDEGWLVPARDTAVLAGALAELICSDSGRRRRASAGRVAAERIGSPAINARKLHAIMENCISVRAQSRTDG